MYRGQEKLKNRSGSSRRKYSVKSWPRSNPNVIFWNDIASSIEGVSVRELTSTELKLPKGKEPEFLKIYSEIGEQDFGVELTQTLYQYYRGVESKKNRYLTRTIVEQMDAFLKSHLGVDTSVLLEYTLTHSVKNTLEEDDQRCTKERLVSGRLDGIAHSSSGLAILEIKSTNMGQYDENSIFLYGGDVIQVLVYYVLYMKHINFIEEQLSRDDERTREIAETLREMKNIQMLFLVLSVQCEESQLSLTAFIYEMTIIDDSLKLRFQTGDLEPLYNAFNIARPESGFHEADVSLFELILRRKPMFVKDMEHRILSLMKKLNRLQRPGLMSRRASQQSLISIAQSFTEGRGGWAQGGRVKERAIQTVARNDVRQDRMFSLLRKHNILRDYNQAALLMEGLNAALKPQTYGFGIISREYEKPLIPLGDDLVYDLFEKDTTNKSFSLYLSNAMGREFDGESVNTPREEILSQLKKRKDCPNYNDRHYDEGKALISKLRSQFASYFKKVILSLLSKPKAKLQQQPPNPNSRITAQRPSRGKAVSTGNRFQLLELPEKDISREKEQVEEKSTTLAETGRQPGLIDIPPQFRGSCQFIDTISNPVRWNNSGQDEDVNFKFRINCRLEAMAFHRTDAMTSINIIKFIATKEQSEAERRAEQRDRSDDIPTEAVLMLLLQGALVKKQLNTIKTSQPGREDFENVAIRMLLVVVRMQEKTADRGNCFGLSVFKITPSRELKRVWNLADIQALKILLST